MKRGTPDHPKMVMLTMELEKIYAKHKRKSLFGGRAEAIGILEILWDWASKFAIQGDIGKWPNAVISNAVEWRWNPDELIYALIESKWLDVVENPARLVIHDIKDHATNTWRQNLENAGLTWWDGSPPRKYKLQKSPNKLQNNSKVPPQPEPEPETKAEPEPLLRASPPMASVAHGETGPDLSCLAQSIHARHPKHRRPALQAVERAMAQICMDTPDPLATAEGIEDRHSGWVASEEWTREGGRYVPHLLKWLDPRNGGWMTDPPEAEARAKADADDWDEAIRLSYTIEGKTPPGGLQ